MQQLSQIQRIPDNAINQCWVVDNAITKQKCDWILSLAEDKWETGKVGGPVKDATKTEEWLIKEEVRKSEVVFTDDNDFNFFTGAGGVLYPPKCFYKDVLDKKKL